MSAIHAKLMKLLALARVGCGGERVNAQARLQALMEKHGISLSELDADDRKIHWFPCSSLKSFERKLLVQTIVAVCAALARIERETRQMDFFSSTNKEVRHD